MAITISELTSAWSDTDATSYASASITPANSSRLYYVYSTRHGTTAPGLTPPSAYGGTWAELGGGEQVDGISAVGAWVLDCSASPGTAGMTVPVDGGVTAIGAGWAILQVAGHDPASTVVQFVYGPLGATALSGLVTLAAAGDVNNAEICFFAHRTSEAQTTEAGWTGGTSRTGVSPNYGLRAAWKIGSFDTTATQSWTTSSRYQGLAFEIKVLGAAAPANPPTFRRNRQNVMIGNR